jgi:hypothetical protein
MIMFCMILFSFCTLAQPKHIDWARDTISRADAMGGRDTYINTIRGSGQLATEWVKLPVDKMKEIMDACYAKGITDVTVLLVAIRQADIARFRRNNPEVTSTNSQLKGRQMLVFKIPRRAFHNPSSAKVDLSPNNPTLLSLMAAGLFLLDESNLELPAEGDDIYFSIGEICPPPGSCDL